MSQQDLYLIDQIKVRNKLSLQAYCDKHGGVVYSYLLTLLEQAPQADDVYEQTIVDLWEKSGTYDKTTKTPLQWTFDLAFQNALVKKTRGQSGLSIQGFPPAKIR
ncbi:hypothetical protein QPK87_15830 [Kamptonema cortianum]|nr:hypothetical protein [Kamptonema cortianum]